MATYFIKKVAQMFGGSLGSHEMHCFLSQTGSATCWVTFGKTWATFYFQHLVTLAKGNLLCCKLRWKSI